MSDKEIEDIVEKLMQDEISMFLDGQVDQRIWDDIKASIIGTINNIKTP